MTEGPATQRSRLTAALSGVTAALLALSLGLIVGGVVWPYGSSSDEEEPPAFTDLDASTPTRLLIPSIKVNAPIVPIENDANRVLQIPDDPDIVGWWNVSAKPGAATGQSLITGHSVHGSGSGALERLRKLKKGKPVDVITEAGRMRYRVTHVRVWSKEKVVNRAQEIFGQKGGHGRLVLVTSAGYNGSVWEANVLAFAKPLGEPRKAREKREKKSEESRDVGREAAPAAS